MTACTFEYVNEEEFEAGGFKGASMADCSPTPPYSAATEVTANLCRTLPGHNLPLSSERVELLREPRKAKAQEFTTPSPPSIDLFSASTVRATTAELNARLNPHGSDTTYHFEYGTTNAYGNTAPVPDGDIGSANVATNVSVSLFNLQAGFHVPLSSRRSERFWHDDV